MVCVLPPGLAQEAGFTSGFFGAVLDDRAHPVEGAVIHYTLIPDFNRNIVNGGVVVQRSPGQPALTGFLPTDATGSFRVQGLPAGTYYLCARGSLGFVDGCRWGSPQRLSLNDMETKGDVRLTIDEGAIVRIHLDDPRGIVQFGQEPSDRRNLILGVITSTGNFYAADLQDYSESRWSFALTVPFSTELKLWTFSRHLRITDDSGKLLASTGPNESFTISRSQPEKVFHLIVSEKAGNVC